MKRLFTIMALLAGLLPLASTPARAIEDSREVTENGVTYTIYDSGKICVEKADPSISVWDPSDFVAQGYLITVINSYAFQGCTNLLEVKIPQAVTTIGIEAFEGCTALRELTLPENATLVLRDAFANCTALETVVLEGDQQQDISHGMFSGCTALKSVSIPSSVTRFMENCFLDCASLQSIEIPDGCTEIESYAFKGCASLQEVVIPDSATKLGYGIFSDCTSLRRFEIPEYLNIPDSMFQGCTGLEEIELPRPFVVGYETFEGCTGLRKVTFKGYPTTFEKRAFANCTSLAEFDIPGSVSTIDEECFMGCSSLESVRIPTGVKTVWPRTFAGCTALKSIIIPSSVNSIRDEAFAGCISIESITLDARWINYNPGSNIFKDCTGLREATFGDGITVTPNRIFEGCTSLQRVVFPESLTTVGAYSFAGCTSLDDIVGRHYIVGIHEGAFKNCPGIIKFDFPSCEVIGDAAFLGCFNMEELNFPDCLNSIGDNAFSYDYDPNNPAATQFISKITELVIPDNVTYVGQSAFAGFINLKKVILGKSLASLTTGNFTSARKLEDIWCRNPEPPAAVTNGGSLNPERFFANYEATLHVPEGSLDKYMDPYKYHVWPWFKKMVEFDVDNTSGVTGVIPDGYVIDNTRPVAVYDIEGHCLYQGLLDDAPLTEGGIYIIRQGKAAVKVRF